VTTRGQGLQIETSIWIHDPLWATRCQRLLGRAGVWTPYPQIQSLIPWPLGHGHPMYLQIVNSVHPIVNLFRTLWVSPIKKLFLTILMYGHFQQCFNNQNWQSYIQMYLKLEHGWMIQWPAAFWRTLSWINAFLEPNSFIANLLSVGWNILCKWLRTHPGLESTAAPSSSFSSFVVPAPVFASSCWKNMKQLSSI